MAKEIEQKFLVKGDGWREIAGPGRAMLQFYVAVGDDRSARIRIIDGEKARLTLKFGGASRVRDEFEYDVPLTDAEEMRGFALGNAIVKTRHVVSHAGRDWEVDEFGGALSGLVLAEVETPEEVPMDEAPSWIGRDVTNDASYYNLSLALNGMPETIT
ncbi:MAG: CYTH domain-containing protein [Aliihoeflea sp.]